MYASGEWSGTILRSFDIELSGISGYEILECKKIWPKEFKKYCLVELTGE